jgi:hypothetical protein
LYIINIPSSDLGCKTVLDILHSIGDVTLLSEVFASLYTVLMYEQVGRFQLLVEDQFHLVYFNRKRLIGASLMILILSLLTAVTSCTLASAKYIIISKLCCVHCSLCNVQGPHSSLVNAK